MEEELNEHDLEERLYAMLYHEDQTQNNVKGNDQYAFKIFENVPKNSVHRYWNTNTDSPITKNPYVINKTPVATAEPKEEEKLEISSQNVKSTIKTIDHKNCDHVILESSDEDEVVEVALSPKPTITIESSDEDELQVVKPNSPSIVHLKPVAGERCVASPVPSVVSSVSDEFIRSDCIALNISSRKSNNHSFDFSLHGTDLLDQSAPAKKKRKKKPKEAVTSTPIASTQSKLVNEEFFATPKSKAKNKKKKYFAVKEKTVPNADIYDSDSNQSIINTNKNGDPYLVTEKSIPSTDVYDSDSSQSENMKEKQLKQINDVVSVDKLPKSHNGNSPVSKTNEKSNQINETLQPISIVDLTENDYILNLDDTSISENIVMGNVTGFSESGAYVDENSPQHDISQYVSTKIPPILNENLDFNNLNGNKTSKRRKYSLATLRAEMDKFYNESWGGENFNHREIQKNMSRDKNLWAIDPKDKMPSFGKRKITCNYCNRPGHRDDACWMKPPVCYMCGLVGHFEPRCPRKICVNCGQPNYVYSTMCRNCRSWNMIKCAECGQNGHPSSHCPDLWRRYHNTIDENMPMEKNIYSKKQYQMYCSGCTRRGHLIHMCKSTLPFSGLPINNPYVFYYRPIYSPKQCTHEQTNSNNQKNDKQSNNQNTSRDLYSASTSRIERNNKRQSTSPTIHETHVNKKRNISSSEVFDIRHSPKSNVNTTPQRNLFQISDNDNKRESNKNSFAAASKTQLANAEVSPDFITITSTNYDEKGQIIQDNEVSDTSDVITSARIYVTSDIIDKLKSKEGQDWLKEIMSKLNVIIQFTAINSFLSVKGKIADQEAFQTELKDWTKRKESAVTPNQTEYIATIEKNNQHSDLSLIPKKKDKLLQQLGKALNSLKEDIGDPQAIYKELTFFKNRHTQLLNQNSISPKQVSNNRSHINEMFKKLNMVLVGQAGLANGSQHLSELYSIQEKLINSRRSVIPIEQRKKIGHHYYSIFSASPRDDYLELLKEFYQMTKPFKNMNCNRSSSFHSKMSWSKKNNCISSRQTHNNIQKDITRNEKVHNNNSSRHQMVFYHQRILRVRPNGAALKKTKVELVKKLRSLIGCIFNNEKLPSKTLKKMKKALEQARMFLANV